MRKYLKSKTIHSSFQDLDLIYYYPVSKVHLKFDITDSFIALEASKGTWGGEEVYPLLLPILVLDLIYYQVSKVHLQVLYYRRLLYSTNRSIVKMHIQNTASLHFSMTLFVSLQMVFCYLAVIIHTTTWVAFQWTNWESAQGQCDGEVQLFNPSPL